MKKKGILEYVNSVANICFIPADSNLNIRAKRPLDYLDEIERKFNPNIDETLKTHLIFDREDFGIMDDNYAKFLTARAKKVLDRLNEKISDS